MYQLNHKTGKILFPSEREINLFLSERLYEFEEVTVTFFDGTDWTLYKDLRDIRRDAFHFTQKCVSLPIINNHVYLKNTEMGKYYQGEGEGFLWEENGRCIAYSYGKTPRTIKGAKKLPCTFKNKTICY